MDNAQIAAWLEPLGDEPTGADLEYDPAFLELEQAVSGRPETQFGPAEPPSWTNARELSQTLFDKTRDLRVAMSWGRAQVNLEGLEGVGPALELMHGLLDRFWDELHPKPDPDDGDTFARLSVLGGLDSLSGFFGDVRQCLLLADRRLGGLRVRDVEVALGQLPPREDESVSTPGQITGVLEEFPELGARATAAVEAGLQALKQLQGLMNDRFGMESAIDVKPLRGLLNSVKSLLPEAAEPSAGADGDADASAGEPGDAPAAASAGAASRRGGGVHSIDSRQEAVRAINLICAYLERSEPTNPAQLLLRRAERLIDMNFLQLVRDFAPDAVNEVARMLGVDPESLSQD